MNELTKQVEKAYEIYLKDKSEKNAINWKQTIYKGKMENE